MKIIAIAGTFDSKGEEFLFIKNYIEELGLGTYTIHTGVFEPSFTPDLSNESLAEAGGGNIIEIQNANDRGVSMKILSEGLAELLPDLYREGKFDAIISLGGSGGTALVTPAMQSLPIGVPKLMVSTMASGETSQYVGTSDIIMMPSVVDVAGLNLISKKIFTNAVHAIVGMANNTFNQGDDHKPLIAATMFGVTTPCVDTAKSYLEDNGYEVLVFHATGTGGKSMEKLIEAGYFNGVLDLTTTEWCDEVAGGVLSAGPNRLEAAGKKGIPQVVSVGALDMVNFGPYETIPSKYEGRNFYKHNPSVTLMRTSLDENKLVGEKIAEKLNMVSGKATLLLPTKGVSLIDVEGQVFYGPEEDAMLFETLRSNVDQSKIEIVEKDLAINDQEFGILAAKTLIELMS